MAGQIPQSFIDQLLDTVELTSLIGEDVALKRSGNNYQGKCPFHDDRSPSFSVSPEKQVYHCFGCGASGNALTYAKEKRGLDFIGAVEMLAKRQGVEVPREDVSPAQERAQKARQRLYDVVQAADEYFQWNLRNAANKAGAIDYLKGRGLSGATAKRFGIGLSPVSGQALRQHLTQSGFNDDEMEKAGLLVRKPGRNYDRFRNRVTFPIRDRRGRTVAFTARVLDDSKPKYLNSSESDIFHKGKVLYGLHEAITANRTLERLIVVEGQMDVIALAQFELPCAVATSGTAITADHLEQLCRLVPQVVFCFDGDKAGKKAGWRALENALPMMDGQTEFLFLFLPDGQDPDSLLQAEGTAGYHKQLSQAVALTDFLFDHLCVDLDMQRLDSRARLGGIVAPHLKRMPKGLPKELMLDELARRVGTDKTAIRDLVDHAQPAPIEPAPTPAPEPEPEPPAEPVTNDGYDELMNYAGSDDNEGTDYYADFDPAPMPIGEAPAAPEAKLELPPIGINLPAQAKYLQCLYHLPSLAVEPMSWAHEGAWERAINQVIEAIVDHKIDSTAALMGYFSNTDIGRIFAEFTRRDPLIAQDRLAAQWQDLENHRDRRSAKLERRGIKASGNDDASALARLIAARNAAQTQKKP
ncbi:DNA primase [Litorivicinus lipolyticus]|uniref:DNA primase n=1 Tax=Litorivicinus lipolyticus TaxID=418701 RepID=A0A5Q2Q9Y1_9GAMM|nr:DNA primase [Litorivicinus lipolyticus]QGG81118.1 DNA primase [Litorivicinus lipolyticus]